MIQFLRLACGCEIEVHISDSGNVDEGWMTQPCNGHTDYQDAIQYGRTFGGY